MKDFQSFVEKVIEEYNNPSNIIDNMFLLIQNDRVLMKEYLELVASGTSLQSVNSSIAKNIELSLKLSNSGDRSSTPKSNLIQSFTELEK